MAPETKNKTRMATVLVCFCNNPQKAIVCASIKESEKEILTDIAIQLKLDPATLRKHKILTVEDLAEVISSAQYEGITKTHLYWVKDRKPSSLTRCMGVYRAPEDSTPNKENSSDSCS